MNRSLQRHGWLLALVLLFGILATVPTLAQDEVDPFNFDSGTSFDAPAGTEIENVDDLQAVFELEDGPSTIVSDFEWFSQAGLGGGNSLDDALNWYADNMTEREITLLPMMAADLTLGGRDARQVTYTDDTDHMGLLIALRFTNGGFGLIDVYVPTGQQSKLRQIFDLAATLDNSTGEVAITRGAVGGSAGSSVDCVISTSEERTAQLRVGPGINRTSIAFLPANEDFSPLGQTEADDGSLWFQLDREEAAPQTAANEIWVAAEAVDSDGDCENLSEASAPPVVPIINAPPPSSSSGGGDSGGGNASVAPAPGTWTIVFSNQGKGSCLDNPTFTFDFPADWQPEVVNLRYTGSTVVMDGQRFNQTSPGVFQGVFTLSNGNSLRFVLRPVSSTYFVGEGMLTGVVDGDTCSNTVPLTASRN